MVKPGWGMGKWIGFPLLSLLRNGAAKLRLPGPGPCGESLFVSFFNSNDSVFSSCNLTAETRAWRVKGKLLGLQFAMLLFLTRCGFLG